MASLLLACASWPRAALAGDEYVDSDARMAARVLAAQGSEAFEQRDFPRALELFQRADTIIPAPTITLMEARTLVELGRLVEALEKYSATQHMLAVDPTNEAFRQAADDAQRETEPLLQRIPTLRVRVHGALPADRLEIQIDGKKVMPALAAVDRPSDPGPHHVVVRTADGRTVTRDLVLAEGAHEDVELTLAPLPAPAPLPVLPAPKASNPGNTAGWALVISGAAFAGVGALTGILALEEKSHLDSVCKPGCPPGSEASIDAFRRERTVSYVAFSVGVLAAAGGGYLLVKHPPHQVGLAVAPGLVAVAGSLP
jgi:hypothetical protein